MKKPGTVPRERIAEALFLVFLLIFYTMWARVQGGNAAPDEEMRYAIVQYIYRHGSLPLGDDAEVRNAMWGISYAYYPLLDYMVGAVFVKLMSFFAASDFALLFAARFVNVLLGVGTGWFTFRIGKRLFTGRRVWLFTCFVTLLPGCTFVFTYVNNDALAVFSTAVIVYAWVRYLDEGWSYKNCLILAAGVTLCTLSYYNAYGFILMSIIFFGVTLSREAIEKHDWKSFLKKGSLVCVIVLTLAGWWFVRNAVLYDGDFLAADASTECAEKYAMDKYKPSRKASPQSDGFSLMQMLSEGYPKENTRSWVEDVCDSFVGRFGQMDVFLPRWVANNYLDFIKLGLLLVLLHPVRTFGLRKRKQWSKQGFFHWCMLIAMIIPNLLSMYYSYVSDYQPQGRYSLPMIIPMTYFMMIGYESFFEAQLQNARLKKGIYTALCGALIALGLFVYFAVIWPECRDVPFSIAAFLKTS